MFFFVFLYKNRHSRYLLSFPLTTRGPITWKGFRPSVRTNQMRTFASHLIFAVSKQQKGGRNNAGKCDFYGNYPQAPLSRQPQNTDIKTFAKPQASKPLPFQQTNNGSQIRALALIVFGGGGLWTLAFASWGSSRTRKSAVRGPLRGVPGGKGERAANQQEDTSKHSEPSKYKTPSRLSKFYPAKNTLTALWW